MKKCFILLLLIPFLASIARAQQPFEYKNFKLEFGNITYKRSYLMADLSAAEISEKLKKYIPTISSMSDIKFNGKVFYGRVEGMMIDYPHYGGKWINILPMLNRPMRSNITIEPKNGSYEVVLTQMEFHEEAKVPYSKVNNHFTEANGAIFSTVKRVTEAMAFMDLHFADIFRIGYNRRSKF